MHSSAQPHAGTDPAGATEGRVLNWGWGYDLMEWIFDRLVVRGKLREMRRRTVELAGVGPGDAVLDVGCGTGTLALAVQERVGGTGRVAGIDPGVQQIARARSKAARRGLPVDFRVGVIERLPFPDASFQVVLSTIMMHHLPDDLKRRGLVEIARVVGPGGRVAVADFKAPDSRGQDGPGAVPDLPRLIAEAGFSRVQTRDLRMPWVPAHPRVVEIVAGVKG